MTTVTYYAAAATRATDDALAAALTAAGYTVTRTQTPTPGDLYVVGDEAPVDESLRTSSSPVIILSGPEAIASRLTAGTSTSTATLTRPRGDLPPEYADLQPAAGDIDPTYSTAALAIELTSVSLGGISVYQRGTNGARRRCTFHPAGSESVGGSPLEGPRAFWAPPLDATSTPVTAWVDVFLALAVRMAAPGGSVPPAWSVWGGSSEIPATPTVWTGTVEVPVVTSIN